jgi:uncharacterized integral membrane protein (TIGR00698 family)
MKKFFRNIPHPDIIASFIIPVVGLLCLFPFMSSAAALICGVVIALVLTNPYPTKDYTHKLLTWSVIGLGAGMNLEVVARVGLQGIGYTVISISTVFILGTVLQKLLKVDAEAGLLITVGTAICGGSAIAAVTPVIKAKSHSVSVALGTVFILNAVALVLFPPIGHFLHLSERAFGLWSALAIHDTSSVVGATVAYGKQAAEIGTTVKLARALWIVPVALGIGFWKNSSNRSAAGKAKKPWFILGFLMAAALVTWIPMLEIPGRYVEMVARRTLVLTLFFIGLGLSKQTLKQVGIRPFILGVALWLLVGFGTLGAIEMGFIQ